MSRSSACVGYLSEGAHGCWLGGHVDEPDSSEGLVDAVFGALEAGPQPLPRRESSTCFVFRKGF